MTLLLQIFTIVYAAHFVIGFATNWHKKYILETHNFCNNVNNWGLCHIKMNACVKSIGDMMRECAMNDVSIPDSAHLIPSIETDILKAKIKRAKQTKGLIEPPKYCITGSIDGPSNHAQGIHKLVEQYNENMLNGNGRMDFYEPRGLREINVWDKDMTFEVFPVLLDEGAPIVIYLLIQSAGQIAKVTLDERHRSKLIESMHFNKIIGICIAFIKNDNPQDPNYTPELVEYGSISEV